MAETRRNLRPPPRVPFQRVEGLQTADPKLRSALHRMQANIERATDKSRKAQGTEFKLVTCKITASTTIEVAHGLGRAPVGHRIRESRIAAAAFEVVSRTSRVMRIKGAMAAGASASVDLEVY